MWTKSTKSIDLCPRLLAMVVYMTLDSKNSASLYSDWCYDYDFQDENTRVEAL